MSQGETLGFLKNRKMKMQEVAKCSRRLEHIRDNLRNMFDNPAERDGSLDALFNFYLQFQN